MSERSLCRRPEQQVPERKIEPAEKLGVPPVLQVVKHGNRRAFRQYGHCEAGVQENVNAMFGELRRKKYLFPENTLGAIACADRAGYGAKPGRNKLIGRFAIDKYQIFVGFIDGVECLQQAGEVDFRATHCTRYEKQRVNTDAHRLFAPISG